MLTKNFYYALGPYLRRMGGASYTAEGAVDAAGKPLGSVLFASSTKPTTFLGGLGIPRTDGYKTSDGTYFGTGITPPTPNDYEMESPIVDSTVLSVTKPGDAGVYVTVDDKRMRISATYDVLNLTDQDLTISEIGLFGCYTTAQALMYDRTVLTEPIVIPAKQSKPVTYEIKLNFET